MSKNPKHAVNPFDSSLAASDQTMYGTLPPIDTGRMVATSIPIADIVPDVRQPRRVIPASIRAVWTGSADDIPALLSDWHAAVEHLLNTSIDLPALLKGSAGDDMATLQDHNNPIVSGYFEVVALASSIYREGLMNPIRVAQRGNLYLIESGERRWIAHALLMLHVDGAKAVIPAFIKSRVDVWAQAAENGQRSPLNAIGMARQLALLVMDMYPEVAFDDYEDVVASNCDRPFYAQVADGNRFPIKRGMLGRVLDVTGLKSKAQISQYRNLLRVSDDLWQEADENNWTENYIREYVRPSKPAAQPTNRLTPVNHNPPTAPITEVSQPSATIDPETGEILGGGQPAAAPLTTAEREFLERAHRQRKNFAASNGWMPIPVFNRAEAEALKQQGYLESRMTTRLPGKPPQEEVRITPAGCAALGKSYPDADTPPVHDPEPPRPASPKASPLPPNIQRESTLPITATWDRRVAVDALALLVRYCDDTEVRERLNEIMQASNASIRDYVASNGDTAWEAVVRGWSAMIEIALNEVVSREIGLLLTDLKRRGQEAGR